MNGHAVKGLWLAFLSIPFVLLLWFASMISGARAYEIALSFGYGEFAAHRWAQLCSALVFFALLVTGVAGAICLVHYAPIDQEQGEDGEE